MKRINMWRRLPAILAAVVLTLAAQAASSFAETDAAVDLVVVVSADNPITSLSQNQLADIFLGRSAQFPDGRRAVPLDQVEGSPLREAFTAGILHRTAAQVRAHWARIVFTGRGRPPRDISDGDAVKQAVAGDPNAIGYIDRRMVDDSVVVVAVE